MHPICITQSIGTLSNIALSSWWSRRHCSTTYTVVGYSIDTCSEISNYWNSPLITQFFCFHWCYASITQCKTRCSNYIHFSFPNHCSWRAHWAILSFHTVVLGMRMKLAGLISLHVIVMKYLQLNTKLLLLADMWFDTQNTKNDI